MEAVVNSEYYLESRNDSKSDFIRAVPKVDGNSLNKSVVMKPMSKSDPIFACVSNSQNQMEKRLLKFSSSEIVDLETPSIVQNSSDSGVIEIEFKTSKLIGTKILRILIILN